MVLKGFPDDSNGKKSTCNAGRPGFDPWVGKIPRSREWQTTLVFLPSEPMNSMKRQADRTLKDEPPRMVGAQYAIGDQWGNNSRKNEEMKPKQKQHPGVDMMGNGSRLQL